MDRRECLKLVAGLAIPGAQHAQQRRTVSEYCFRINPHFTIKAHETIATPAQYLTAHPEAKVAINGPQFGLVSGSEQILGLFHYRGRTNEEKISIKNNLKEINGYLTVNEEGNNVAVLPASTQQEILLNLDKYWMAIGTFPLLVINGTVRPGLERAKERAYRSAIGTKSNDICFAVSEEQLTLNEWAQHLVGKGYAGALYLDGGPYASLAARDAASKPYTRGQRTTIVQARMIISAELQ